MGSSIYTLHERLITFSLKENIPLGLANGKMGLCVYFYHLSCSNICYRKIGEQLLDDILENIATVHSIDLRTGLAGIGLGITHLVKKNYVRGDINTILKNIDDVILKNISYPKYHEKIDLLSLMHILYYLCIRQKYQKKGSDNEYIYQESIIRTTNNLYERITLDFLEEPLTFNINYTLPQLAFALSEVYKLRFYNYRIIKIVEELSYRVLSKLPVLHSNRLYLAWAIDALNKEFKDEHLQEHINLLLQQTNINCILDQEIKNKSIYFKDGIISLYCFINNLQEYFSQKEIASIKKRMEDKMYSSEVWRLLEDDSQYFSHHIGLEGGFTGIDMLFDKYKRVVHEK